MGNLSSSLRTFVLKYFCIPFILQKPPANTMFLHTAYKQFTGSLSNKDKKEYAILDYSLSGFPKKIEKLTESGTHFILNLLLIAIVTGLLEAFRLQWAFFMLYNI